MKSWTVSDALWSKIEPHIPKVKRERERKYRRKPGGGRKPLPARQIFSAIVYVLRTGCQWKALPKEYGSASSIHAYFRRWQREGFSSGLGGLGWPNTMRWRESPGNGKASMEP